MKKFLISFLLITILICNSSLHVYASDNGGGGYSRPSSTTDTTGFNDWSKYDKFCWWKDNLISLIGGGVGCLFNPLNWNYEHYMSYLQGAAADKQIADFSENYQDYIANKLGLNDSGEVVVDDELMDIMYIATTQYIEEETGFFIIPTLSTNELIASNFYNKDTMDAFKKYINDSGSDIVFVHGGLNSSGAPSGFRANKIIPNVGTSSTAESVYTFLRVPHDWGIINSNGVQYSNTIPYLGRTSLYDSSWNAFTSLEKRDFDFLSVNALVPYCNTHYWYEIPSDGDVSEACYYQTDKNGQAILTSSNIYFTIDNSPSTRIFTADGRDIRIYKTLDDFKNYSVGTRPYYITDKFQDYDINGDNSCIVTESDLSNGSVYGDVYNYIINNYDNPDGLTEDELRDILNDYFGQGSGGSGSGSGSGDSSGSGSSGGGLSGFLSGLGSLGDAILGILGKLIEYIGKAIDLITNGLTGIIDKIPKGVTDFMAAMFPFMPEEFFTALTLAMVLGVVCIVIKIFK